MSLKTTTIHLPTLLCLVGAVLVSSPATVLAQGHTQAESHNDAGKALFKERRYLEAYKQFRQAAALSPEGRFYFNVCFSLNYLERFQEAIDACEKVKSSGADAKLLKKTKVVLLALRSKVPAPSPGPSDTGPTDTRPTDTRPADTGPTDTRPTDTRPTDTGPADTGPADMGGRAHMGGPAVIPGVDPFATAALDTDYSWALGVSLVPVYNSSVGTGNPDIPGNYGSAALGLTFFSDFMWQPEERIGLRASLGFTTLSPSSSGAGIDPLTIIDVGGAIFKHFALTKSIDITPLAGAQISIMQPALSVNDSLVTLGAHLEVSADLILGADHNHVLSVAPALNFYAPASNTGELTAEEYGLQSASATLAILFGYRYRFSEPFGSSPLFSLE